MNFPISDLRPMTKVHVYTRITRIVILSWELEKNISLGSQNDANIFLSVMKLLSLTCIQQ